MEGQKLQIFEGILRRLSKAPENKQFLLRGGFMAQYWFAPRIRIAEDLDFLVLSKMDRSALLKTFRRILGSGEERESDGLEFDVDGLQDQLIWPDSPSPGLRLVVSVRVKGMKTTEVQIDVCYGDPLAAPPVELELPSLTEGGEALRVWTVQPEIACAWKLHGLFELEHGGWRAKDLYDLYLFASGPELRNDLLRKSVDLAFQSRNDPPGLVRRLLYGDFGRSRGSRKGWAKFLRERPEYNAPEDLSQVVEKVSAFLKTRLDMPNNGRYLTALEARISRTLGGKAYGSIGHLPGSRTGPADKNVDSAPGSRLINGPLKEGEEVIVQEKLDGSCVAALRLGNSIQALGRGGDLAAKSPNIGRRLWARWVRKNQERFLAVLNDGEHLVGEWLALAHGTRYDLTHEPFVAFDLIRGKERLGLDLFLERIKAGNFTTPALLHRGKPLTISETLERLGNGKHGTLDEPEGAVWRLEKNGRVSQLAKFVRPGKVDGTYLPENSGKAAIFNRRK